MNIIDRIVIDKELNDFYYTILIYYYNQDKCLYKNKIKAPNIASTLRTMIEECEKE